MLSKRTFLITVLAGASYSAAEWGGKKKSVKPVRKQPLTMIFCRLPVFLSTLFQVLLISVLGCFLSSERYLLRFWVNRFLDGD